MRASSCMARPTTTARTSCSTCSSCSSCSSCSRRSRRSSSPGTHRSRMMRPLDELGPPPSRSTPKSRLGPSNLSIPPVTGGDGQLHDDGHRARGASSRARPRESGTRYAERVPCDPDMDIPWTGRQQAIHGPEQRPMWTNSSMSTVDTLPSSGDRCVRSAFPRRVSKTPRTRSFSSCTAGGRTGTGTVP